MYRKACCHNWPLPVKIVWQSLKKRKAIFFILYFIKKKSVFMHVDMYSFIIHKCKVNICRLCSGVEKSRTKKPNKETKQKARKLKAKINKQNYKHTFTTTTATTCICKVLQLSGKTNPSHLHAGLPSWMLCSWIGSLFSSLICLCARSFYTLLHQVSWMCLSALKM